MNKLKILLVGAGTMAYEYTKVLKSMNLDFMVVGRRKNSAEIFQEKTGVKPITGSISKFLSSAKNINFDKAIVAVTGDQLGKVTIDLIKHGIKSILVEKPGGLDESEIRKVKEISKKFSARVYIAYNRRFYASVIKAKETIEKDTGILSFHFEFNELSDRVAALKTPAIIKQNWLLHNSTHVIDLAFFFAGLPTFLQSKASGFLKWHKKGAIFTGFGVAQKTIPFTYHANWLSTGRWGLEVMTHNHRLIFKPLEKLQIQKKGNFKVTEVNLKDRLDLEFKPGLFKEVEAFLNDDQLLCTIEEQAKNVIIYNKILKGTTG